MDGRGDCGRVGDEWHLGDASGTKRAERIGELKDL